MVKDHKLHSMVSPKLIVRMLKISWIYFTAISVTVCAFENLIMHNVKYLLDTIYAFLYYYKSKSMIHSLNMLKTYDEVDAELGKQL